MMTPQEKINKTSEILTLGKSLAPDRFPQPSKGAGAAWAKALDRLFDNMHPDIWDEAVTLWAMELVGDRMVTPRDIKDAAYAVRDRWERDPLKAKILEDDRRKRQEQRDREIADGTFWAKRGFLRPSQKHPEVTKREGEIGA